MRYFIAAAIALLLLIAGGAYFARHLTDGQVPDVATSPEPTVPLVTYRDSVKKGAHTITGTITVPNPCTVATATAQVESVSSPAVIDVAISAPTATGICLEEQAEREFTVTAEAAPDALIRFTVNGVPATSTLAH